MFTGIVEQMGRVASITNLEGMARLVIAPQTAGEFETALGDSVAVNGACLTVAHIGAEGLSFDVSRETLALTTLGGLKVGSEVNLERAMRVSDRLGGHMVSGHVDGKARILHWDKTPAGWGLEVLVPAELARYVAPKGSITLEGVSLTVNAVADRADGARVSLMLIPVTLERTTLGKTQVGDVVNLETDLIARYLERLVSR